MLYEIAVGDALGAGCEFNDPAIDLTFREMTYALAWLSLSVEPEPRLFTKFDLPPAEAAQVTSS